MTPMLLQNTHDSPNLYQIVRPTLICTARSTLFEIVRTVDHHSTEVSTNSAQLVASLSSLINQIVELLSIASTNDQKQSPLYFRDRKRQRPLRFDTNRIKMSGYYYPPTTSPPDEDEFDFNQSYQPRRVPSQQTYNPYTGQSISPVVPQGQFYNQQQYYQQPQQYPQQFNYQTQAWVTTPTVPSNYPYQQQNVTSFPAYSEPVSYSPQMTTAGPSRTSTGYLSPGEAQRTRATRAPSYASNASSTRSDSDASRGVSPDASEMAKWGIRKSHR